eukprot:scaffold527_cov368-Prasinococcus_capsulatus_cf.AAC.46
MQDTRRSADFDAAPFTYTIYVLNPTRPSDQDYLYAYGEETPCPGALFQGKDRYAWIDLTAGPVSYGPTMRGEGHVLASTSPHLGGEGEEHRRAFLVDIVTVLNIAVKMLLVPPLQSFPVQLVPDTHVHLVTITSTQHQQHPSARDPEEELLSVLQELEPLLFKGQRMRLSSSRTSLAECDYCVSAYNHALRSSVYAQEQSPAKAGELSWEHLDGREYLYWLEKFLPFIMDEIPPERRERQLAVFGSELGSQSPTRTIFVVALDLQEHSRSLLFHDDRRAVTLGNIVAAVRTGAGVVPSFFGCNGQLVLEDLQALHRPVLAALLEAGWGVAASHLLWSKHHNRVTTEYSWAVGRTPFGPLSAMAELSFVQRDSAARNVIFTQMNQTISHMIDMFQSFEVFGEPVAFLTQSGYKKFLMRWNVMFFKLQQAIKYFSVHNYDNALYYSLSAHHEVNAINSILRNANIRTSFKCWTDRPVSCLGYSAARAITYWDVPSARPFAWRQTEVHVATR